MTADLRTALLRCLIGQLDVRWGTSPHGGQLVVIAPAVRPAAGPEGQHRQDRAHG